MKKSLALLMAPAALAFLSACGDTVENVNQINQMGMLVADSEDDLPECTDDNEGEQAVIKGESVVRVCIDGDWVAMDGTGAGGFSCKTEELKDKSGLKIVCNGDSIGVVLNGEKGRDGSNGKDGEDGKNGEDGVSGSGCSIADRNDTAVVVVCGDSTMTIDLSFGLPNDTAEADSERTAISLDSVAGFTQKGPFLKGSTVYLYELSDGRTLKQTNGNFTSKITSDDGHYKFSARDLVSQYAMVIVDGYYRNEVTGEASDAPIRLSALTDMRKRSSVNVNLLTNMEFDRVYYLVTREKMTVKQAKRQAQREILKQFHIELDSNTDAEDMDVFGSTDADAALLAVSVLLQGDSNATALSVLLTEISNDIAEFGEWKNDSAKAAIADWALVADSAGRLAKFDTNVTNWGLGNAPDFAKFVRKFSSVEYGLGVCGSNSTPVGMVKNVSNANSKKYYAKEYTDTNSVGGKIRFICIDADNAKWRVATDIEKDTMGWGHDFEDGAVYNGLVNMGWTYVYQNNNWRLGTALDSLLVKEADGKACLTVGDTSTVKYDSVYYVCSANVDGAVHGWVVAPDVYNDTYEARGECSASGKYGDGSLLQGRVNANKNYACDNGEFREATPLEIHLNKGCVEKGVLFCGQSCYKCSDDGWRLDIERYLGTMMDDAGKEYRTITIEGQTWMAENLNYQVENSSCYDDYVDNCAKYGRLYTWAAAITACPEGWHLPSKTEWETLFMAVGGPSEAGKLLKSQIGWNDRNGLDAFGFAALPAGAWSNNGVYNTEGDYAGFWSSTESSSDGAYFAGLPGRVDLAVLANTNNKKVYRRSVRCLKD